MLHKIVWCYKIFSITSGQDYEVRYEILCFGECIHCIVHSTKLQAYDLYAPSTMASDDHSSVSLSTSKRRLVFFAAIDVSRGCALSTLIMYDGISNSNFNNNHASYLQLFQWNCYKFNHLYQICFHNSLHKPRNFSDITNFIQSCYHNMKYQN